MSVNFSNCTINNLTINRPGTSVRHVLRRMYPRVPTSGPHCLVNINGPRSLIRNMHHNVSVFSYMVPAHGTQGNRLFIASNIIGVHGTGCGDSANPLSPRYSYCAYHGCSHTCLRRLSHYGRVLNTQLGAVRGLHCCRHLVTNLHGTVRRNGLRDFMASFCRHRKQRMPPLGISWCWW